MQHTTKWKMTPLAILLSGLFCANVLAEETSDTSVAEESTNGEESCLLCDVSGSVSIAYDRNAYDRDSFQFVENVSWSGSLSYKLSDKSTLFASTGGYRALEDKTGTYATDSVIGVSYRNLLAFGETGKIGLSGQLTIPTSETSQDTELYTAFRVALPVSFKLFDANISVQPRLRKNFYKYETMNGRVLTEWQGSISVGASYSFDSLTLGVSALGGNGMSFKGQRSRSFTYGTSAYASYSFLDNWSTSLSASSGGRYYDAEQGTLGNVDLFDTDSATYAARLTYSF